MTLAKNGATCTGDSKGFHDWKMGDPMDVEVCANCQATRQNPVAVKTAALIAAKKAQVASGVQKTERVNAGGSLIIDSDPLPIGPEDKPDPLVVPIPGAAASTWPGPGEPDAVADWLDRAGIAMTPCTQAHAQRHRWLLTAQEVSSNYFMRAEARCRCGLRVELHHKTGQKPGAKFDYSGVHQPPAPQVPPAPPPPPQGPTPAPAAVTPPLRAIAHVIRVEAKRSDPGWAAGMAGGGLDLELTVRLPDTRRVQLKQALDPKHFVAYVEAAMDAYFLANEADYLGKAAPKLPPSKPDLQRILQAAAQQAKGQVTREMVAALMKGLRQSGRPEPQLDPALFPIDVQDAVAVGKLLRPRPGDDVKVRADQEDAFLAAMGNDEDPSTRVCPSCGEVGYVGPCHPDRPGAKHGGPA